MVIPPVVCPALGSHACTPLSPPPHHRTRAPSARTARLATAFGASKLCVQAPDSASQRFIVLSSPPLQTASGLSHPTQVTPPRWSPSTSSAPIGASGPSSSSASSPKSRHDLAGAPPGTCAAATPFADAFRRLAEAAAAPFRGGASTSAAKSCSAPPSRRQTRAVPSLDAVAKRSPPGAAAISAIAAVWPTKTREAFAEAFFPENVASHIRATPSCAPATSASRSFVPSPSRVGNSATEDTALFAAFGTATVSNRVPLGDHSPTVPS